MPTPEATPEPTPTPAGEPVPYLITFAAGTSAARQLEILDATGATDVEAIPQLAIRSITLDANSISAQLAALIATPEVRRVEADRVRDAGAAPNDSSYADQWSLPHIGWEELHGTVAIAGTATVAILDTGVQAGHPDLDGVVLPGWSALPGADPMTDPNGHGTWMAGIVAAETDNGTGVAGTAYAGVSVLPITVLGADGTGQDSDIIAGVVHAADADADVILMAFSNPGFSAALQAAIDYAWASGSVLVAATGNDGVSTATFPAGDRGVIGVTSTDASDAVAASANRGPAAFMAAPGVDILTTASFDPATAQPGDEVVSVSGTSAAAASVAGAAALLAANEPELSNGVVVSRLARTADAAGDPADTGNGRLNLLRAMSDASTDAVQPAGAAPVGDGGPLVGPYAAAAGQINIFSTRPAPSSGRPSSVAIRSLPPCNQHEQRADYRFAIFDNAPVPVLRGSSACFHGRLNEYALVHHASGDPLSNATGWTYRIQEFVAGGSQTALQRCNAGTPVNDTDNAPSTSRRHMPSVQLPVVRSCLDEAACAANEYRDNRNRFDRVHACAGIQAQHEQHHCSLGKAERNDRLRQLVR